MHSTQVKNKRIKIVTCCHKTPYNKNMKKDSVRVYVHMKRDTPLPLYASVNKFQLCFVRGLLL